jgi:drug/metabolite transporter (DMT)-like permease
MKRVDQKRLFNILGILFAVIAWGGSFIATKVAIQYVSPITVVWLRFAIGVVILGIAVIYRGQIFLPEGKTLLYFALVGLIGITFHQWLQSNGLVTSQAGTTAWIVATTPVFMAILGWVFLREKLLIYQVLGIALATLGVILVVSKGELKSFHSGAFGEPGDLLILLSALNWAVFSILSRWGLMRYSAAGMMFYVMFFGWIFTTIFFISSSGYEQIQQLTRDGWLAIIFLGVACSGFAYIFWFDALQVIPASQVGSFLYIEPLVAMVIAWFVLQEPILIVSIVGGCAIILGVWLVNRRMGSNKDG